MIAILDKVFKAIVSLFVLSSLNEQGIDILEDYFYLAILYQLALFAYRPFALAKYIPFRKDILYYFVWLLLLLFIGYTLAIKMFWIVLLAPLQLCGYYFESNKTIIYYVTSVLGVCLIYWIFGNSEIAYMMLITGNLIPVFIGAISKETLNFKKYSLLAYSGPLILNSVAVMLYTRIDVFILDYFSDDRSNEVYLTSVRLFDYCAMLVTIVMNYSLIKVMKDEASWLYSPRTILIMVGLGIVVILSVLPLLSNFFHFDPKVFLIYVLTLPFIALGLIRNNFLLKRAQTRLILNYSVIGVIAMLFIGYLGFLLKGTMGLALSTLLVQILLVIISWDLVKSAIRND